MRYGWVQSRIRHDVATVQSQALQHARQRNSHPLDFEETHSDVKVFVEIETLEDDLERDALDWSCEVVERRKAPRQFQMDPVHERNGT